MMTEKQPIEPSKPLSEEIEVAGVSRDAGFGGPEGRRKLERRLLWKIDLRMSILGIIYILNYIDRNNASAARLRGFQSDLNLTDSQYASIISIAYVGYIIMQIPANMLIDKSGAPAMIIAGSMVVWGAMSILTGICHDFVGALMTRFFLGFVEAAFFPGSLLLLSMWYKREELGLRIAVLFCGNILSNAFGSLFAAGILDTMEGKLGQAAWRWLFFIEGSLTIFFACLALFILPNFPHNTRGLTDAERTLAVLRMQEEDASIGETSQGNAGTSGLRLALTDWKTWWYAMAMTARIMALSFNLFLPTLAATMGYGRTVTLLMCAPPYIFATLFSFAYCRISDKLQIRFNLMAVSEGAGILGFIIAMSTMNIGARYFSLFLMAQSFSGLIISYAWMNSSFYWPPSRRAAAIAFINAFSQLGDIAGSYIWPTNYGPSYRYSYGICIAASGLSIAMSWVFRRHLSKLNKALEREATEGKGGAYRFPL